MGQFKRIEIYTDGACSQNGTWDGGFGVVVVENGNVIRQDGGMEPNTTNNIMEMKAIIRAIDWAALAKMNDKDIEVVIYTDSAYIVNCIDQKWYVGWRKNGWKTSKKEPVKNKELWLDIIGYLESNDWIKIIKVAGHADNNYNNMADEIAVRNRIKQSQEVKV